MRLKKHFYALICILFASICSLQAKVVTLTEAGTLSGMINDSELASLTELTVNGPINGSDIKIIRAMGGTLKTLDLKNANIVKGGDSYYLTNYFTQDNVIGDYMFYAMTALEKIAMPKDVWAIGSWNSDNPWNAEKTKIGGYPNNYDSYYNNNDQFGCASFYQCVNLKEIEFPSTLVYIGSKAFGNCVKLTSITIPEGVELMGNSVFMNCAELISASLPSTLGNPNKMDIEDWQIRDYAGYNNINGAQDRDYDTSSAEYYAHRGCLATFYNCPKLKNVTLAEGIKLLMNRMFLNCTALTSITLPSTVTRVNSAFMGCSGLTKITFPETTVEIGSLQGCTGLTTLSIPTNVNVNDFYCTDCSALTSVSFKGNVGTRISSSAFSGCAALASINIPTAVNSIGTSSFDGCAALASLTMPETLASIGEYAFRNSGLTSLTLYRNLTIIGKNAFDGCTELTSINFPAALTTIGARSLRYCRIDTLRLPATVTEIGQNAFYYAKFDCVEIPSTITKINSGAFYEAEIRGSLNITPNAALAWGDGGYTPFRCYGNEYITNEDGTSYNRYYHLPDVYWNSAAEFPRDKFGQIDNLYLPANGAVSSNNDIGYIFYNGLTKRIDIAYTNENRKYSFSVNKEMKTQMINYRKHFSTNSGYGEAAGWKTIVLPFDVKEISYERDGYNEKDTVALAPFGSKALETAGTLPFWLYELGTDGKYKAATEIKAHKAYLICMPNNEKYPSENNISGYVNFTTSDATNGVTLKPTAGALKRSKGTKFDFVPTYEGVMQHDTVYVLNENNYYNTDEKNYPAGSVFIKNYSEHYSNPAVYPFEAYLVTNEGKTSVASAPMLYSIGGGDGTITGIEDIPFATPEKATKAYSRNGVLYINTNADRTINIYDVTGRTVRIIEAREGMNEVHGLDSGIYLLEGQKVVIGR